jgi:hypothetical protein
MRAAGVRNVLICCADHRRGHFRVVAEDADCWPDGKPGRLFPK